MKPIVQRAPLPVVMSRPAAAVAVLKATPPPPAAPPAPKVVMPPRIDAAPEPAPPPVRPVEVMPPLPAPMLEAHPPTRPVIIEAPAPPPRIEAPKPAPAPEPARRNEDLAHLRRGIVLQARGDHAGAIEAFSRAIEHDAACVEAWSGRGISREALGQMDEARRDYCRSIEIEVRAEIDRQLRSAA